MCFSVDLGEKIYLQLWIRESFVSTIVITKCFVLLFLINVLFVIKNLIDTITICCRLGLYEIKYFLLIIIVATCLCYKSAYIFFRVPYPFVKASQHPRAIVMKPTHGDFLKYVMLSLRKFKSFNIT